VGGVLRRIGNSRGLLVGDAAGAVSPLTAGGLDPCVRLSDFAARVTADYLETGDPAALAGYSGEQFRRRFASRLLLRGMLARIRRPFLLELAAGALHIPPLDRIARRVFFGRGSFPDVPRWPEGRRVTRRRLSPTVMVPPIPVA
jgi:flavin-dependent dehydrogenase